jgi:anti-sigma B factor antagonist
LPVENEGQRFSARLKRRGSLVVIELLGELDVAACDEAARALEEAITSASGGVVVDVEGLSFMDSTGVQCLFKAKPLADAAGIRLAVLSGSGPAHRVLALVRVQDGIEMVEGFDEFDPPGEEGP